MTELFVVVLAVFGNNGALTEPRSMFVFPDADTACYFKQTYAREGATVTLGVSVLTPQIGGHVYEQDYTCAIKRVAGTPKVEKRGLEILSEIAACETDCDVCFDAPLVAKQYLPCADLLLNGKQWCKDRCKRNVD